MDQRLSRLRSEIQGRTEFTGWFTLERLKMESYRLTTHEPTVIRRARALETVLRELPMVLSSDDLLPGSLDDAFAPTYNLFRAGLDEFQGYCTYSDTYCDLEGKVSPSEIDEVRDFWIEEPYEKGLATLIPYTDRDAMDESLFFAEPVTGHTIPDFSSVIVQGTYGLRRRIEEARGTSEGKGQVDQWEAMIITLDALDQFQERLHGLASSELERTDHETFARMKEALSRVPREPARDLYEAVLSYWLAYLVMHLEQSPNPYAFSLGRMDRTFRGFMPQGWTLPSPEGLDDDPVAGVLGNLWLKINVGRRTWGVSQNAVVGGVDPSGADTADGLTRLMLRLNRWLGVPLPTTTLRCSTGIPREVLEEAYSVLESGMGHPTFVNDGVVIPSKELTGMSHSDATEFTIAGCQEPVSQGLENARTTATWLNLAKCLELALNDGVSTMSSRRLGPATGLPTTVLEVETAYRAQVESAFTRAATISDRLELNLAAHRPAPFLSCITSDCISQGKDFRAGGARHNFSGCLIHGLADVADSFANLRRLEENPSQAAFPLDDVLSTFRSSVPEEMRLALDRLPHYGTRHLAPDDPVHMVFDQVVRLVSSMPNAFGGHFRPGFSTPSTHVLYGKNVGALPSGRASGTDLAYGIGPTIPGASSPTSTLNAITSLDNTKATHGAGMSLTFAPSSLTLETFIPLLETYFQNGGRYLHVNYVDVDTLESAMEEPEKYPDLIVRVHGMSTYFVNLDPVIQRDLVARARAGL